MPPPSLTQSCATPAPVDAVDSFRSIAVLEQGPWRRRLLGFIGPGYLVAVGYMDPGNWATDLAGGAAFGYRLLWVVLLASLMATLLQVLSARLGIVTGLDLAQACRQHYSRRSVFMQWILCELAICAADMAEVIGTAIALNLLFGLPLMWGVTLTVLDVLLVLWFQRRHFRYLEATVMALLTIVFLCFAINLTLAQPDWSAVAHGFVPHVHGLADPHMLYLAIGIIGATVMPHNLYLHSSVVQTRRFSLTPAARRHACGFATIDVALALLFAFCVNAAILVTAAAVFHFSGHQDLGEIQQAYHLLTPLVGTSIASFLFALALLASGQSSTLTATLAGQIVMEGYVQWKLPAWARRLLTRAIAIVPAFFVTAWAGESGTAQLLIFSQVFLSLQLPFAIVPLVRFTSDRALMGAFANHRAITALAAVVAGVVIVMNLLMLATLFGIM